MDARLRPPRLSMLAERPVPRGTPRPPWPQLAPERATGPDPRTPALPLRAWPPPARGDAGPGPRGARGLRLAGTPVGGDRAAGGTQACPRCGAVSPGHLSRRTLPSPPSRESWVRAVAAYLGRYQLVPYGRTRELFSDLCGHAISPATLVAANPARADQRVPVEGGDAAADPPLPRGPLRRDGPPG